MENTNRVVFTEEELYSFDKGASYARRKIIYLAPARRYFEEKYNEQQNAFKYSITSLYGTPYQEWDNIKSIVLHTFGCCVVANIHLDDVIPVNEFGMDLIDLIFDTNNRFLKKLSANGGFYAIKHYLESKCRTRCPRITNIKLNQSIYRSGPGTNLIYYNDLNSKDSDKVYCESFTLNLVDMLKDYMNTRRDFDSKPFSEDVMVELLNIGYEESMIYVKEESNEA